MSSRRRARRRDDSESLLPLLDTLSNGVGAAVLLFLVFTVAGAGATASLTAARDAVMLEIQTDDARDLLLLWVDPMPHEGARRAPLPLFHRLPGGSVARTHALREEFHSGQLAAYTTTRPHEGGAQVRIELTTAVGTCWRFQFSRADRAGHWRDAALPGSTISALPVGIPSEPLELARADLSRPLCLQVTSAGRTQLCPGSCPGE